MNQLFKGDCLEILKTLPDHSADALITDPPAGINFMGKDWDSNKGGRATWVDWLTDVMKECLRVLKPGAHALVWAIPRTSHWTGSAIEDAGFEVRDVVTHLFGSGFPKSLDISKAIDKAAGSEREVIGVDEYRAKRIPNGRNIKKNDEWNYGTDARMGADFKITAPATDAAKQWQGFGTALKPAAEFWFLCRKPISEKTIAGNVLKYGTGGLNIDGSRISGAPKTNYKYGNKIPGSQGIFTMGKPGFIPKTQTARFPANLVLTCCGNEQHDLDCAVGMLNEQSLAGGMHSAGKARPKQNHIGDFGIKDHGERMRMANNRFGDSGGASRFFYCAKASAKDKGADNGHPTVKSTKLMSYLIKLITPPNGTVLDPFMGSGSTGVAAIREGFKFIGIESDENYFACAKRRIDEVS